MASQVEHFGAPQGVSVGSQTYYAAAMAAGFYGVEDDGRSFRTVQS